MGTQWSDKQSTLMVEMWDCGFNESDIANELGSGISVDAVIKYIDNLDDSQTNRLSDTPITTIEEVHEEVRKKLIATKKAKKQTTPEAKPASKTESSAPKAKPTPKKSKPVAKDSEATSKTKPAPQPKSKSEPKTQLEPKTKTKPKVEPTPKAKTAPKPKRQPETKTKLKAETKNPNKEPTKRQPKPSKHLSIMELTEFTCRWPFGDPQESNFHFCGNLVEVGEVYCLEHCIDAYQNYAARREEKLKEAEKQANAQM